MSGVQIGLDMLHYAIMEEGTDTVDTPPVYDTPVRIEGAITATITPTVNAANLYADDALAETANTLGEITVALNTKDLPLEHQAALLGSELGDNGELISKSTDIAPYVAILFRMLKSDGTYRYVKLLKGRFQEPESNAQTRGENIEYNTPTINATFMPRIYDKQWKRTADEGENGFNGGDTWFDSVESNGSGGGVEG